MRLRAILVIGLIWLAGCRPVAAPGAEQRPGQATEETGTESRPGSGAMAISGRVEVAGLLPGAPYVYLWSAGDRLVAYKRENGIWAIRPDGREVYHLVQGNGRRELAGWWEQQLVYLEQRGERLAVGLAAPGQAPVEVAQVARPDREPAWPVHRLYDSNLYLLFDGRLPAWVSLATGEVTDLGGELTPARNGTYQFSPDGRHLAFHQRFTPDPVRLVDLARGTAVRVEGEAHLGSVAWAPDGSRWAVLAAEPGSGLPAEQPDGTAEGATHLDLGDPAGQVRHLHPPEPLKLLDGPWWSPDGRQLAVTAEERPATDPRGYDRVTAVWVVTPETNRWSRAGGLELAWVQGWHPDGGHLIVMKGAMGPAFGRLPVAGGRPEYLQVPPPSQAPEHLDYRLLVLTDHPQPTAYLPGSDGGLRPVAAGHWTMDHLTRRGGYAAWIEYGPQSPLPSLVISPLG